MQKFQIPMASILNIIVTEPNTRFSYTAFSMMVLIIRHAKAEPRAMPGLSDKKDAARPLTDAGRRNMHKAAKGLRTLVPELDQLVTSPLVRAQQTAAIVSERYADMPVTELALLAPGGSMPALLAWLREQPAAATVALVGHEPDLGVFASYLLSESKESFISLKKGAACLIEFTERPVAGDAKLEWLLQPNELRELG